jgi:hypothetical protein
MGQYDYKVERQRLLLEAEEWAKGVTDIHAHSLDSMWYAKGRKDGSVIDTRYNSGRIVREIVSTGEKIELGKILKGEELIWAYEAHH